MGRLRGISLSEKLRAGIRWAARRVFVPLSQSGAGTDRTTFAGILSGLHLMARAKPAPPNPGQGQFCHIPEDERGDKYVNRIHCVVCYSWRIGQI
jgi:hypothetical protein